jgi:hypothetical protein
MGWFGFETRDYTDQIFKSLVRTRYAKKQFALILSAIFVMITRFHIKLIIGLFFNVHPVFNFALQVFLSIFLVLKSNWIHNLVQRFKEEIYALSRYFINNYTPDNFRAWQRNAVLIVCSYLLIYLMFIEINSSVLIEYILQFLISYFIIDGIEQGTFERWWDDIKYRYQVTRRKSSVPVVIKEDYLSPEADENLKQPQNVIEELHQSWMVIDGVNVLQDPKINLNQSVVIFD